MADRAEPEPILSRDDLTEYQRSLRLLSDAGVAQEYRRCWEDARYDGKRVPPAATMQQLVSAWKVLRNLKGRK